MLVLNASRGFLSVHLFVTCWSRAGHSALQIARAHAWCSSNQENNLTKVGSVSHLPHTYLFVVFYSAVAYGCRERWRSWTAGRLGMGQNTRREDEKRARRGLYLYTRLLMPDNNDWVVFGFNCFSFDIWGIYKIRKMYMYAESFFFTFFAILLDFHWLSAFASSSKIYQCVSFVKQNWENSSLNRMSEMTRWLVNILTVWGAVT